jgi:NAD(P)-dependent dehydrogenase (short-subunit alcohol dehydrogenase family)
MMPRLQGKVAVITGGSSGLGLAMAQRFVKEGAFVYLTGRRQNDLDMATALIGDGVAPVRGDVQDLGDLDRLYERIKEERGKIDVLVANAGFIDPQPLVDATEENFDKTFGTKSPRSRAFRATPLTAQPRQAFVHLCERGPRNSRTVASVSTRSAPARLTRPSSTRRRQRKKALTRSGRALGPPLRSTALAAPRRLLPRRCSWLPTRAAMLPAPISSSTAA